MFLIFVDVLLDWRYQKDDTLDFRKNWKRYISGCLQKYDQVTSATS